MLRASDARATRAALRAGLAGWRAFCYALLCARAEAARRAGLKGLLGPPSRPKPKHLFVEFLEAKSAADARRMRSKMEAQYHRQQPSSPRAVFSRLCIDTSDAAAPAAATAGAAAAGGGGAAGVVAVAAAEMVV